MKQRHYIYLDSCLDNGLSPSECLQHFIDVFSIKRKGIQKQALNYVCGQYFQLP
jgi:hypothetical protein